MDVLGEVEDLSWSSLGVEQAHAGAAQVMRHHPDFHEGSRMSRATLYMMRSLLSSSEHDVKLAKLEDQMSALDSATPGRISGRHVFLSDCFAVAASLLPLGQRSRPAKSLCEHTAMLTCSWTKPLAQDMRRGPWTEIIIGFQV